MRRLLVTFVALVSLSGLAHAAQAPIRVVGFAKIGGLEVSGATTATARRAFGVPAKVAGDDQSCRFSWPGLAIGFYTLVYKDQCGPRSAFSEATITRPWVTERGLRQGDPVSKARQLYPTAARTPGRNLGLHGGIGLIIRTSPAIGDYGLAVGVKNGRVTSLYVLDPQGGE